MNGKWSGAGTADGQWLALAPTYLEQLSDEEFWRHAHELAFQEPASPAEYLCCNFSCGRCLIPLSMLYEVVPPPQDSHQRYPFALLPAMPAWMAGIFAWHGEMIAVVDLDAYLSANLPLYYAGGGPDNDKLPHDIPTPAELASAEKEISGTSTSALLLVANHAGLPVGLLVPASEVNIIQGDLWERADKKDAEPDRPGMPVLDMARILTDLVQQIGMADSDE